MSNSFFSRCPRCGSKSYEHLITHSHCIECLYSDDLYKANNEEFLALMEAEKTLKELESKQREDRHTAFKEAIP